MKLVTSHECISARGTVPAYAEEVVHGRTSGARTHPLFLHTPADGKRILVGSLVSLLSAETFLI